MSLTATRPLSAQGPCGFLDDPKRLYDERFCLLPVSKNVKGKLDRMHFERQECKDPECVTLKVHQSLRLRVDAHDPCDSDPSTCLDGNLVSTNLVHALYDGQGRNRGPHTADITWTGQGCVVVGQISGMTNVGTHREPPFDPCQECHAPGWMEGRLCGRIVRAENDDLLGCLVVGAYRFQYEPSDECDDAEFVGTIEAVIVCPCEDGKCVDFTSFTPGARPNPWIIDDCEFLVLDSSGAPTQTTRVWDNGNGGPNGLDGGWLTRISLGSPADSVRIRLMSDATPPALRALDAGGNVVDSAMVTASGVIETIVLTGPGITTVEIRSPQNETLIHEFCVQ